MRNETLTEIYSRLYDTFGPQHWWPGESAFEIAVGAVLTQNTSWANVEKAVNNLKTSQNLVAEKIHGMSHEQLAELIRPAGYFNIKAKRLKNFVDWLFDSYQGDMANLEPVATYRLREELLGINGIGPETADSILLYALGREIFVVDAYTARVAVRHGLIDAEADYEQLRYLFESNLDVDRALFNEFHALLVRLGKEYCRVRPRCECCPLNEWPHQVDRADAV